MRGIMWDVSLSIDEEMERDPNWHLSPEGMAALYWIRKENERLSALLKRQKAERENRNEVL